MRVSMVLLCLLTACGGGPAYNTDTDSGDDAPDFMYQARITSDAPELVSFTVDGQDLAIGGTFAKTFPSFPSTSGNPIPVVATTTGDTLTFSLVPTECGGACPYTVESECESLSNETETWSFFHAGSGSDDPLMFGNVSGNCTYFDGQQEGWSS